MEQAIYDTIRVDIQAGDPYLFRASGSTLRFKGFLAVYEEARDEDSAEASDVGLTFPEMDIDEILPAYQVDPGAAFHPAAATLHRGYPGEGAGRKGHWPPKHLRANRERHSEFVIM